MISWWGEGGIWRTSEGEHFYSFQVSSDGRANALNVSFRISLRWPIHIINPADKTKLSSNTPHRRSTTVSLETYPLHLFWTDSAIDVHNVIGWFLPNILPRRFSAVPFRRFARSSRRSTGNELNSTNHDVNINCQVGSNQDGFGVLKSKVCIQRMDCDDGSLEAVDDEGWSRYFPVL